MLVIAVLVSAVSSTQTTILPTARGTLSMATYRALPSRFKTVHPRFNTPSFSTLMMGVVASVYYIGMTLISDNILQDSITLARPGDRLLLRHHRLRLRLVLPQGADVARPAISS